MYCVCW